MLFKHHHQQFRFYDRAVEEQFHALTLNHRRRRLKQRDHYLINRCGNTMLASETHDDAITRINFHPPPRKPVGVQGIDLIRRRVLIATNNRFHQRVV